MNTSKKTFALAQMCIRRFSQTAVRNQTEVASKKFSQLKEGQKYFGGVDEHQPVHIKGGFTDKALYQLTILLTVVGLGLTTETLYKLTFK